MRSPVAAMLWENWRLTRLEAAWKLALGIVAASVVLTLAAVIPRPSEGIGTRTNDPLGEFGAAVALAVLLVPHLLSLWLSVSKLKGGSGGFPFSLLFVRPVRTAVLVSVPMAYQAALSATIYLVSALVLRSIFDHPFPLLSVAASIAAFHLVCAAADWSTRSTLASSLGVGAAGLAFMAAFGSRGGAFRLDRGLDLEAFLRWPAQFDFSLAEYVLIAAIGLASFGVAIAGVARQRHGLLEATTPWRGGFPRALPSWFGFRCPTASATRAQMWFELKSGGLHVLALGATLAIVIPVLFAVSVPLESLRPQAIMGGLFAPIGVLAFGANAFGIRWKQGRSHGVFEATQPQGTTWMAGLKVLVRSGCLLAALSAVGVSVWASLAYIAVGQAYDPLPKYEPLRSWQHAIEAGLAALTGYQLAALAVVVTVGVAVMVALRASLGALWARYPRRMNLAGWLLLLHGLVLVVLAMIGFRGEPVSETLWAFALGALVLVTRWIDAPVIVFATVYVCWRALAERLLTPRFVCVAGLVSGAFAAAWVTLLNAAGVELASVPTTVAAWLLSPVLLPLMATVLAPWSLSRVRHA